MRHHNNVVADFEPLVKFPPRAVASPLRSTVPLVDFWRTPESRFAQLSAAVGVALLPPIDVCFEFPVRVQRGRGKASCGAELFGRSATFCCLFIYFCGSATWHIRLCVLTFALCVLTFLCGFAALLLRASPAKACSVSLHFF